MIIWEVYVDGCRFRILSGLSASNRMRWLSLSEIADNQGISRQGVRDAIKRAEALLFEMEEWLGFARRFRILQEGLEQIEKNAREIEEYNSRLSYSKEIHDRAAAIAGLAARLND